MTSPGSLTRLTTWLTPSDKSTNYRSWPTRSLSKFYNCLYLVLVDKDGSLSVTGQCDSKMSKMNLYNGLLEWQIVSSLRPMDKRSELFLN